MEGQQSKVGLADLEEGGNGIDEKIRMNLLSFF